MLLLQARCLRDLTVKEIADEWHHFVGFVLERKMPCVDQVKLDLGQVALVRVSAVGREDFVVLAPDDERRRLMLAEICLHLRIKRQIGAIVVEQVHLDFGVARPIEQRLINHDPYPRYLELAQGRRYLEALKQGLALVAINTKVGKRKDGGEGWKREAYMNS